MSKPELLAVYIGEAKPNPMFTEEQRATVRFLTYNKSVRCAECGKRTKYHWTALYEFEAVSLGEPLVPVRSGLVHPPLTPVCGNHPISPAFPSTTTPREREAATEREPQ